MSLKILMLEFVDDGVSAEVELIEDEAPATVKELWVKSPFEGQLLHDVWSGPQVFLPLETVDYIPPENLTMFVQPGDVFFYARGENYFHGAPYGRKSLAEIGLVYDRNSGPRGPRGQKSVNMFGKIVSGLEDLQKVCQQIIFNGPKTIRISQSGLCGRERRDYAKKSQN